MLVAPSEPPALKAIGHVSLLTEQHGADVLIPFKNGFVGCQRKEYGDLLASLHDGRLAKELAQMKRLHLAVLIVEGKLQWTTSGVLIQRRNAKPWTKTHHRNLLRSVQAKGVWVEFTDSLTETIDCVRSLERWLAKESHLALDRRPGPPDRAVWGSADCRDFQLHILMGFPGVGPVLAEAIIDHFGGRLPLHWTVTEKELCAVPGLGKKKASRLLLALGHED